MPFDQNDICAHRTITFGSRIGVTAGTISSALLFRPYNPRHVAPGTRLGVYDITAPMGEGGMGQVYRATVARFEREAKTLASLNQSLSLMGLPP
jgi:hypothetical protein